MLDTSLSHENKENCEKLGLTSALLLIGAYKP